MEKNTTRVNRIGERYERLLVTAKAPSKHGYARWWCLCDCGKSKNVSGTCLQQGRVKSCGCLRKELCTQKAAINSENNKLPYGEAAFNLLYAVYRNEAKIKNREFTLTKEEFRALTSGDCFYCGLPPKSVYQPNRKTGKYVYNGVDRKNNLLGYIIDNSVSCCKTCNLMKRTQTDEEFLKSCKRVVDYNHKKLAEMTNYAE